MSSSNITHEEVARIARLARLSPSRAQAEALASELSGILQYVAKLDEVDTSQIEATPSTVHTAGLRPDVVRPSLDREAALVAAPAAREGGFSVPKVLEVDT